MTKVKQKPAVLYRLKKGTSSGWMFNYPHWHEWSVWSRYKTVDDAKEALKTLRKSKPKYYEFKLG